jgi:hypothetical protein
MIENKKRYQEIWITTDDWQSMCALVNGDIGWLMYLRREGDAGFSSRNPGYVGAPDATVEYLLNNGQRDEYPLWTCPDSVDTTFGSRGHLLL